MTTEEDRHRQFALDHAEIQTRKRQYMFNLDTRRASAHDAIRAKADADHEKIETDFAADCATVDLWAQQLTDLAEKRRDAE